MGAYHDRANDMKTFLGPKSTASFILSPFNLIRNNENALEDLKNFAIVIDFKNKKASAVRPSEENEADDADADVDYASGADLFPILDEFPSEYWGVDQHCQSLYDTAAWNAVSTGDVIAALLAIGYGASVNVEQYPGGHRDAVLKIGNDESRDYCCDETMIKHYQLTV